MGTMQRKPGKSCFLSLLQQVTGTHSYRAPTQAIPGPHWEMYHKLSDKAANQQ